MDDPGRGLGDRIGGLGSCLLSGLIFLALLLAFAPAILGVASPPARVGARRHPGSPPPRRSLPKFG